MKLKEKRLGRRDNIWKTNVGLDVAARLRAMKGATCQWRLGSECVDPVEEGWETSEGLSVASGHC